MLWWSTTAKYSNAERLGSVVFGGRDPVQSVREVHLAVGSDLAGQSIALIGVAMGAGAILLGQWITTRAAQGSERARLIREDRNERKAVIMRFLSSTQRIERAINSMEDGMVLDQAALDEDLHTMWLAIKEVAITCSDDLFRAGNLYCTALQARARGATRDSAPKKEARQTVLTVARAELDILRTPREGR